MTTLCPRCGDDSFEVLSTHSYCPNCDFSPEFDEKKHSYCDDFDLPEVFELNELHGKGHYSDLDGID